MTLVLAARSLHVAMGATWLLATLLVAATGRARRLWLRAVLVVALLNMLAGIELWHALHAGAWGSAEHLLVVGTFCGFLALGVQAPVALGVSGNARRLAGAALTIYRVTAVVLVAAAAAMIGSRYA